MKKGVLFLLLGCVLLGSGIWIGTSGYFQGTYSIQRLEEDLSSFEGLMRLIPQLKNKEGKFEQIVRAFSLLLGVSLAHRI